jgi:triacylglycerol lipase
MSTKEKLVKIKNKIADYNWFNFLTEKPFKAKNLQITDALWFADMSNLVYNDNVEFVRKTLSVAGFSGFKWFDKNDTTAFVAYDNDTIIVSFRGTEINKIRDILYDVDVDLIPFDDGSMVHEGFLKALDQIWVDLNSYIKTIRSGRSLWFTGHSLGGALATLAARRSTGTTGLFTFGCPRVGDRKFSNKKNFPFQNVRFVNDLDIVPTMPPISKYKHNGKFQHIVGLKIRNKLLSNIMRLAKIRSIIKEINENFDIVEKVEDHKMESYITALKTILIKRNKINEKN